jgi:molybdopterin-guanine dinucleotide biosynthesis protein A
MEPLCAAYGTACRDAIADSLTAGDLRAIGFHDRIRVGILPLAEIRALADPELVFFNVNTADDLAKADLLWRQHASSQ